MRKLLIPESLKQEFATIDSIWHSNGETRRVDSLILTWVKYEKQLRRIFCYLVYQHPKINEGQIDKVLETLVNNRNLYPETFIKLINLLNVTPVNIMIGPEYKSLWAEITRIKKYRNKIIHGQNTGLKIQSNQLERDVLYVINWIASLAQGAESAIGYNGIHRNTFRKAKAAKAIAIDDYPFSNVTAFKKWLTEATAR